MPYADDVTSAPGKVRNPVVRPRDAASLILLRGEGKDLEVLAGRRPLHVRFMPGVHVFPGGAIALTVLGLNLLGDGLRDVLDPKTAAS